jgi:hypothetical protein
MTRRFTVFTAIGFVLLTAVLTSTITTRRDPGGARFAADAIGMALASSRPFAPPAPREEKVAPAALAPEATDEIQRTALNQQPTAVETDTSAIPSMVIRNGDASVLVDSLETAVARVTLLTRQLGGYVANTAMQAGPDQVRSATLTLKIPSALYDGVLGGLAPLGKVETATTNSEDVGEEFVDVRARVANARRLEDRLVGLLASRAGKLQDVLAVERELSRVREEIERYEGRLRYLRTHVAMSTLSVTVHEALPLVGQNPSASVFGDAFWRAWRNFVVLLAGSIATLGFLVPVAVVLGAAAFAARRWLPRVTARPGTPGAPSRGTRA